VREDGREVSSATRVTPSGAGAAGLYLLFVVMSLIQQPGDIIDKVDTKAPLLQGTRLLIPVGLGLLGLLSIGAGLFLRRRQEAAEHEEDRKELVNA
jgi:hypothetical protein